MADDQLVNVTRKAGLAVVVMSRPEAYNALDLDLAAALLEAMIECDEDPSVRAVLLTGSGPAFCAGGDIRQMKERADARGDAGRFLKTLTVRLHAAIGTIAHMPKPVVTAVDGPAAGAGFSLAMAGDLLLASERASFTVAYTGIALPPDGGLSFHLSRAVGPKVALELTYSNRRLTAHDAQALGIVTQVLPDAGFLDDAINYAEALAQGPTRALGHAKRLIALGTQQTLEAQLETERQAIAECGGTQDFVEGIAAFLDKRTPDFHGQ